MIGKKSSIWSKIVEMVQFSQMANYLNSADDEILVGWEVGKNLTRM
jgi:hypothetical protein